MMKETQNPQPDQSQLFNILYQYFIRQREIEESPQIFKQIIRRIIIHHHLVSQKMKKGFEEILQ